MADTTLKKHRGHGRALQGGLAGLGSGAISGVSMGAPLGLPGMLAGGLIGGLGAGAYGAWSGNSADQAENAALDAQDQYTAEAARLQAEREQRLGEMRSGLDSSRESFLASRYNGIAKSYDTAQSNLDARLAQRGLAGQAMGSAQAANLDAARANATTNAQADWDKYRTAALAQIEQLGISGDQQALGGLKDQMNNAQDIADSNVAGFNQGLAQMASTAVQQLPGAVKGFQSYLNSPAPNDTTWELRDQPGAIGGSGGGMPERKLLPGDDGYVAPAATSAPSTTLLPGNAGNAGVYGIAPGRRRHPVGVFGPMGR